MEKKNLKTEQGRSMVEMLGVLAVMGLLTIIGIAGFRIALNKHYANQTVDRLMRRAVVVAAQANFGQNLSLHEFNANDGEYPIPQTITSNAESFTLTVNEVPEAVCQQIVGLDWKLAKIIPQDCSDTTMKFMFLNDLTDCSTCVAESVDCPPDEELQCGSCSVVRGFLDNNSDCEGNENGTQCVRGKCSKCPINTYLGTDNNCHNCNTDLGQCSSSIYAHRCLGKGFGRQTAVCYRIQNCTETADALNGADEDSCKNCPNRCYLNGTCYLANKGAKTKETDGTCSCRLGNAYLGTDGNCLDCNTDFGLCSSLAYANHCPG